MKLQDLDFRVWDISEKVFYNDLGLSMLPSSSRSKYYDIEPYSCIKDMHGNKLYENDIVAHMSGGRAIEYHSVVKFNRNIGAFGLEGIEYPFFQYPDGLDSRFKVIGNIHENPELLGGEE